MILKILKFADDTKIYRS